MPAKNKMSAVEKENSTSAIFAKDRMSAVKSSLQEIKMSVVEDSLQEIKMSAVEGDNSPNSSASAPHQNHPPIPKPKSKTEIGFPIQIPSASLDMTALQLFFAVLFNIILIIGKTF